MFRFASDPLFTQAETSGLFGGGSEIFQMCVEVFSERDSLKKWFLEELSKWTTIEYSRCFGADKVYSAMAPELVDQILSSSDTSYVLQKAIELSSTNDLEVSIRRLARIYMKLAPVISKSTVNL